MIHATSAGFSVKTKDVEIAATEGGLDKFVNAWMATLAWAERNPGLCLALFCLLAFWLLLNYLRSRDSKRMKYEYMERREAARVQAQQPQLPLNDGNEEE